MIIHADLELVDLGVDCDARDIISAEVEEIVTRPWPTTAAQA